jgi:hypothetical protein
MRSYSEPRLGEVTKEQIANTRKGRLSTANSDLPHTGRVTTGGRPVFSVALA